jgi:hypothetical protein
MNPNFDLPTALIAFVVFGYFGWKLYRLGLGKPLPTPWGETWVVRYAVATATLSAVAVGCGMAHMWGPLPLNRLFWQFDVLGPYRWGLIRDGYGPISEHVLAFCSLAFLPVLAGLVLARAVARSFPQPTVEGTRALRLSWLDKIAWIVCLVLLVPAGFSLKGAFGVAGIVATLMIAGPVLRWFLAAASSPQSEQVVDASVSRDRQRILKLLEEGKINGGECATLLAAVVEGARHEAGNEPLTAGRKRMLIGALIVLIAFFLPWFSVDLVAEASRIMPSSVQLGAQYGGVTMEMPQMRSTSGGIISVHAGDIANGLGWWVLALSLTAAALPFLVPAMPRQTQRAVTFVGMIGASVIELYLLTSGFGSAVWGIWLALAGTAVLWVGSYREYLAMPRRGG